MEKKNEKKNGLPGVSIIIPTLNEADYVGYLLFSLTRQTYRNFEVIVSDGLSEDKTIEIVKSFKSQLPALKTVVSKKRSPSNQRNRGEEKARFKQLLFLDADTILPPDFLEKSLREIKKKKLDIAFPVTYPFTTKIINQYYYIMLNWQAELLQNIFPVAGGWAIFSRKDFHRKIKGFDEKLKVVMEDMDYVMRAVKAGAHFKIIKNSSPFISARRLDYEGIGGSLKQSIIQGIYIALFGKYRAQKYLQRPYGDFQKLLKSAEAKKSRNRLFKKLPKQQLTRFLKSLKKMVET